MFWALFQKLLPLYFYVFLGFIAGRFLGVGRESLAKLLLYLVVPLVFFLSILDAELTPARLGMPFVFLLAASIISIGFYNTLGRRWKSPDRNILSFMVGSGNTGYFGLPAIIALWGIERVSNAILVVFGYVIFEFTIGFYLTARGHHGVKDSIKRVLKLPALYAFFLGCGLNLWGVERGEFLTSINQTLTSVYSVLGLMVLGLGVSRARFNHFDWSFILTTVLVKFLVWPTLMATMIFFDRNYFHLYAHEDYQVLMLMSLVPLAANGVVIATELKAHPEKAAICILATTMIALFLIPALAPILF
ncbi:AEC family transporter [bacterium]|nr:AEC family transporter [bacterium]